MRPSLPLLLFALIVAVTPPPTRAEEPAYTVIESLDAGVEVREYAPMLVAEVVVDTDDFVRAGSLGFQPLADYIFGNNTRRERIGMTAPVTQEREGERIGMTAPVTQAGSPQGWVVGFVMPARYSADTLPRPRDPRVRIVGVPSRSVAAIRFSGRWSTIRFAENLRVLERQLATSGWIATAGPQSAQYDAPWVPGPMRRNEILLPVQRRK
jgi:hypothetical protein